ncbi:hypothetical protein [Ruminococcus flavefaciens]|uniref:hypothetical protein n=1 Tax=Ruminococcus flavefaciens TaxID=1265 RepID=UPI001FA93BDD|nr:hypothetical protein [Ruminococcus flavefaciens]
MPKASAAAIKTRRTAMQRAVPRRLFAYLAVSVYVALCLIKKNCGHSDRDRKH